MMLLVATGLCWVTCMSFTMLVLFHMKDAKMSNYYAMCNFQTRVTKFISSESSDCAFHLPPCCCVVGKKLLSIETERFRLVTCLQFINVIVTE